MHAVVLAHETDWEGWRDAARRLALAGVAPEAVAWSVGEADGLFGTEGVPAAEGTLSLPRGLVELAQSAIQARDRQRFALLYRLVWRVHGGERALLEKAADAELILARRMDAAVRRDGHKMRAFVRFREVTQDGATHHVAWFEPSHFIVESNADFFARRFAGLRWSILTPYRSAHWDGVALHFAAGAARGDVPEDDGLAEYWRVYFSAIFNPARLKPAAMRAEMPKKYWRNLPEAAGISEMIRTAPARAAAMVERPMLTPPRPTGRVHRPDPPPAGSALAQARQDIGACRRCGLWAHATQAVFGEGPADARIMLVGEQPGDQEDLAGRPFVGPAGQMLDRALGEAGLDRDGLFITNAVKHFKYEPRGKRRLHKNPDGGEIQACRFWLGIELAEVPAPVVVLMGASAARAVLGRVVTISRSRGTPIALEGRQALVTVHPSYLLRLPDEAARAREYAAFVADLRLAASLAG